MPDIGMEPKTVEAALAKNRRRREAAGGELEKARRELAALLVRGRKAGVPVATMARAAGVSRETAHKLLREEGSNHG